MPLGELKRIDDPRDALGKAKRIELAAFARANGVQEINPRMPAEMMRDILRERGLTNIQIPNRRLGAVGNPGYNKNGIEPDYPGATDAPATEMDASSLAAQQWARDMATGQVDPEPAPAPAPAATEEPEIEIGEKTPMPKLLQYASANGVKIHFGIRKATLLQLIREAQDAQDTA